MKCPEGHESTELDYCSVCGAAMSRASAPSPVPSRATAPSPPRVGASAVCPQCSEPRADPDARYCEVCRYDFVARAPGPPPARQSSPGIPAAAPVATPQPAPAAAPPGAKKWELVLTIDPSLDDEPDPATPPPKDPERIFPVEVSEMLVGRRDDKQNIRPAVSLNDPGASRRHAKFLLGQDGKVILHDLGSTNGTKLNGQDVVSGSQRALEEGDEVTLGRWTRIKLRARP